ncbi:hypothetical protein M0R45_015600 [Rubus argutus]|uniref:Uncharacterized protein n=2 Tax=Rubus argutus TaxID=59490 RepID=A0AAW1XRA3_RUBAR
MSLSRSLFLSDLSRRSNLRSIMIRQPTQLEEKPRSHLGSGSKQPLYSTKDASINIRPGDPRKKIDLDEIYGDVGGGDYKNIRSFVEPAKCLICGLIVQHRTPSCPYRKFVPHNVSLPPGIQRVCKCCRKRDGHPGEDWKAYATPKKCFDCGSLGEHWTGDADCPTKAPKQYWDDEDQQTGRPFLPLEEEEA